VAEGRFKDLSGEYWQIWLVFGDGYEGFVGWLDILKRQVSAEVASVWKGGSKSVDHWYKKVGAPAVEAALTALVKEGTRRKRAEELTRLELVEASTRATEGGFREANKPGATEPSGDESTRTDAGPAVSGANNGTDRRAMIDVFISKLAEAGRKILRKDIWTVAGYKNATEFERFQRGDARTTRSAAAALSDVLQLQRSA